MFLMKSVQISILSTFLLLGVGIPQVAAGPSNRHYLGGGAQVGRGPHKFAIGGKVQIRDFGPASLSVRPDFIIGDEVEIRAAVTAERAIGHWLTPYAGGGLAYNTDGSNQIEPMVSGGVDVNLGRRMVVRAGGNWIFDDEGIKAEAVLTGNYAFE